MLAVICSLFSLCLLAILLIKKSYLQNCVAEISVNIPIGGTLLSGFSELHNTDQESFDREVSAIVGDMLKISGNYRVLMRMNKPTITTFKGKMTLDNLAKVGCFKQIGTFEDSLLNPLFEAFDANVKFYKSEKMKAYGLDVDVSQLEVFQGKANYSANVVNSDFTISNKVSISQRGHLIAMTNIMSRNSNNIISRVRFPIDFVGQQYPIICGLNPDFMIIGKDENEQIISSETYEGIFLRPFDYNFISFFSNNETEMKITGDGSEIMVLCGMDALNSSINIISDNNSILNIYRCNGIVNIWDTVFPLINKSELSNIEFYFKKINNIDIFFKNTDDKNVEMFISIDGLTNKVIIDGKKVGTISFLNMYNLVVSDFVLKTLFTTILSGFFVVLFTFIFNKKNTMKRKIRYRNK